jgi:hypothetical protein
MNTEAPPPPEPNVSTEGAAIRDFQQVVRETLDHEYGRGHVAGFLQGWRDGRVEMLVKQVSLRFDSLTRPAEQSIRAASTAALNALVEHVLTARTLEDALPTDSSFGTGSVELGRARSGLEAVCAVLRYALLVTSVEPEALIDVLNLQPGTPAMQALMTTAEKLSKQGEGRGRAEVVIKQLSLRFGPLPDDAIHRIQSASIAEFDALAERVLSAKSLEEALG